MARDLLPSNIRSPGAFAASAPSLFAKPDTKPPPPPDGYAYLLGVDGLYLRGADGKLLLGAI